MAGDVITKVLKAEAEAEQVLQEGRERSRCILAEAGKNSDELVAKAREAARNEGEVLLARTREEAESEGMRILAEGREEAERVEREATPRIAAAASAVVKAVVGNERV